MNEVTQSEDVLLDSFCRDLGLEVVYAGRGKVTLDTYSVCSSMVSMPASKKG